MDTTLPISACIITFNEEENLPDCLASVSFCDEIVIIDSHSTDRTREIAEAVTDRVIERPFPGHIEQKNFAIDQASNEWVLCLDADERVSEELRAEILEAFRDGPPDVAGFTVPRLNHYLGRWIRHCGWYPDRKLRLFRRSCGRWGGRNPHDHVMLEGETKTRNLQGDLLHYSYRDLAHHLKTINSFTSIMAREKLKEGQGFVTLQVLLNPPFKFFKMYVLQLGFLDGWQGLICSIMGSFYVFLKYAKLWELVHLGDPEEEKKKSSYVNEEVTSVGRQKEEEA